MSTGTTADALEIAREARDLLIEAAAFARWQRGETGP
jgi:hypothetical protein